ncbi:MAG TPA: hypothetical protein PLB28_07460 [Bacteroidales bacterium]|nr:hypothetical protein [Bacteroidales bacterium]
MSIKKTYQTLVCPQYGTYIEIGGARVRIEFKGGRNHPTPINGFYSTDDPSIISAMDSSKNYGKEWVCVNVTGEPEKSSKEVGETINPDKQPDQTAEPIPEINSPDNDEKNNELPTGNNGKQMITGINNAQQARDWLHNNKGVPFTKLRNKTDILSSAEKLNIEFANIN